MAFSYKSAEDYESLLGLPEVQGFLEAVRAAEGTSRSTNPYTTGFGFTTIDSLEDHPRELHSWGPGNKDKTSAAGAYQALQGTWDEVAQAIGLTDFSPKSQDIFALARADYRGALDDILSGDIKTAVNEARKEWASFPNAGYPNQKTRSMSYVEDAYQRGFNKALNTPANLSRTATGFSVSPNVTALGPAVSMMGDTLVSGLSNQTGFTAVPTPTQASRDPTARGYGQLANSLANAEWAGTNLSGTNFGLPAGYTSQVAQRDIVQAAPVEPVTRGSLPDIATTIDPGRLGAVTNASSTLAAAAPQVATGTSALSTTAPATGLLDSIALGAAPVGQPSSSLASTATGATNTTSNSPANAYGALASSLSQAGLTNLSGTTQTQAPSVVAAVPVSTPAPAATPAPASVPTTTAPTTTSKTDADFRSGRDKDRAAFDPDPNAKDQGMKVSIAPTVGRVAGGLLGSMVAGPIGGLLGATLGGKIGSGELGLSGLLGSMAENTDSFTVDNPFGSGRGLLDVSKGPVSIGSLTATATPNSGGYRSVDSNTGWTSYTSPLGITTTMVGDNIVGGPGLSPAAGGNAAGFK